MERGAADAGPRSCGRRGGRRGRSSWARGVDRRAPSDPDSGALGGWDDHADAVDHESLGDVELGEVVAADDDPGVSHDELPCGAWEEKAQERQLFAVGERDDGLKTFPHGRQLVHVLDALQDREADRDRKSNV